MESGLPHSRVLYGLLLAFSLTAVASIAMENIFIWSAVALFLFMHAKVRRRIDWPRGIFPWATLLLLLTLFLGALVGVNPAKSFMTVHKNLTFLLMFLVGAMGVTAGEVRKLLLAFVGGAAVCSLRGMWEHFLLHRERIDSFSGDKMVFGGMLMAALLLLVFFLRENPRNPWLWAGLPLLGAALFFTQTRGAWIGFVAGFLVLAWRMGRRWLLAGCLALVGLYFLLPAPIQERIRTIPSLNLSYDKEHRIYNSSQTRVLIWVSGWRMIQDHPWGVGFDNVSDVFPKYKIETLNAEASEPHLHNDALQMLAQDGWLGLAAYLFWIFAYFWTVFKFRPPTPREGDVQRVLLSLFLAVLVWGMTEYTFSHQFMNIQFFLLGLQAGLWKVGAGDPAPVKA